MTYLDRPATWHAFQAAMVELRERLVPAQGEGLALLTGSTTSPTFYRQLRSLCERFPGLRWYVHEPAGAADQCRHATRLAFGRALGVQHRFDRAELVLSLDDDFLGPGPAQIPNARRWIEARREGLPLGKGPSQYVAEPTPSLTGVKAASVVRATGAEIAALAVALADGLGVGPAAGAELPLAHRAWLRGVADGLRRHGERALVTVGAHHPPEVQALGFSVNAALGSLGRTIELTEPVEVEAADEEGERSLSDLARDIVGGGVDTLIVLDSNPAYTAPADLRLAGLLDRVPLRVHAGLHADETAALCHWHVPLHHAFETWSDARAVDGTATVIQPTMRPLYGHLAHELLALLAGDLDPSAHAIVQATWREILGSVFEARWPRILHDGFVEGTAARPQRVGAPRVPARVPVEKAPAKALEVIFRPDPSIWDGRFANNPWLQELPKPLTKLTWDNVAAVSPAVAARMGLHDGDLVDVALGGRSVRAPIWVMPGQAERTVTLFLGYGRRRAGGVADGIGYDAYTVRPAASPWLATGAELVPSGGDGVALATTQVHHSMEGRELVRTTTPEEVVAGTRIGPGPERQRSLLYPQWQYHGRMQVLVPLGLRGYLAERGYTQVHEVDWTDEVRIGDMRISAVPAIHFSKRTLFDRNRTLWTGYAIESGGRRVYFAGDTAYGPLFPRLAQALPRFDLGIVPIGAYEPRELMRASHTTPEEAVQIGRDLGIPRLVGMHWGAIRLTDEPPFEPPDRFLAAARAAGYVDDDAWVMRVGETRPI